MPFSAKSYGIFCLKVSSKFPCDFFLYLGMPNLTNIIWKYNNTNDRTIFLYSIKKTSGSEFLLSNCTCPKGIKHINNNNNKKTRKRETYK